jgi:hypothetical protein
MGQSQLEDVAEPDAAERRNLGTCTLFKDLAILVSHLVLLDLWKNAAADA